MSETPQQDITDLWQIYQNTKAQLEAIVTLKNAVLAALTALQTGGTPDFKSISESGSEGGESYNQVALQERYEGLVKTEMDISKLMYEQRLHAIKVSPGMVRRRVSNTGYRRGW